MDDLARDIESVLARCDAGGLSPAMGIMEMLIATEDAEQVERALRAFAATSPGAQAMVRLLEANQEGCARVAAMLRSGVDSPPKNASVEEGVAFCRRLFDWSVGQSEEASVALYSLGNPALLDAATREIVSVLEDWGSLGVDKCALDIGCGIGRMEEALASHLRSIQGLDVSERMVEAARRRCSRPNVSFSTCSGLDLRELEARTFDLVLAIDSFPYLVQSGTPLVRTHFREAARVLRAGGELVFLNFSYRDDLLLDRRDVATIASESGFDVLVNGDTPFELWNGSAFRLRVGAR